jgi:formylglycine-generating enzyme required for sulfatase activity
MRFYCENHGKDVFAAAKLPGRIVCYTESEIEQHYLGNFPAEEFWEYCCSCDSAWRSNPALKDVPNSQCLRCKCLVTACYLCDQCGLFTLDSDDGVGDRTFVLVPNESPIRRHRTGPADLCCPGCLKPALSQVYTHCCDETGTSFSSARKECPLCFNRIQPAPSFPSLVAVYLNSVADKNKSAVTRDILDNENNRLVPAPRGEFLVITNGAGNVNPILLPGNTSFQGSEDYEAYVGLYDCDEPTAGEVRILSPAVVDKKRGGWVVKERGRLEIVPPQHETQDVTMHFPGWAEDYLKSATRKTAVSYDSGKKLIKVVDQNGQGAVLMIDDRPGEPFLLPRITEFLGERGFVEYFKTYYKDFYECTRSGAGNLWIVDPAMVRKTKGGWRLSKKGVLEIRPSPAEPTVEASAPDNRQTTPTESGPSPTSLSHPRRIKPLVVAALVIGLPLLVVMTWRLWPGSSSPPVSKGKSMMPVPNSAFLMGRNDGEENERPAHRVTVKAFYMDAFEITRQEYQQFIDATKHQAPPGWANGKYPAGTARLPVTGVDWYDAESYCKWTNKRLPTEEEWELAARGFDGRKYPWGNDWKPGYANAEKASQGLTDVDIFKGASPYGAIGMIGNAWEWTATKLAPYPGGRIPPQELGDGKVDLRVIRGGSWQSDSTSATTTYRWGWPSSGGKDYSNTGFRCVSDGQPAQ